MKIALVDAYYLPGQGYQSGPLYRQLVQQGHTVRVFTSCFYPASMRQVYSEPFPEGVTAHEGGEVHRLPGRMLPRNMVACPAVGEAVRAFQPDLTYVIYVNTFFGAELFLDRNAFGGALFASFGEHMGQRRAALPGLPPWLRDAILDTAFFLKKRRHSRRCIEISDAAMMITPSTFDYILDRIAGGEARERLRRKCALYPLGFDPDIYGVDEDARSRVRSELGLDDDTFVAIHSCKITPEKHLDKLVAAVEAAMRETPNLRMMLVGFREGVAESDRVRRVIERSDLADRFLCLPFAPAEELAALFNAADCAVWFRSVSVSIQEAMGTGLYMLLNRADVTHHLITSELQGRYFDTGDYAKLQSLLVETARRFSEQGLDDWKRARVERGGYNRGQLGYDALAKRLVEAGQDPAHAVDRLSFAPVTAGSDGEVSG